MRRDVHPDVAAFCASCGGQAHACGGCGSPPDEPRDDCPWCPLTETDEQIIAALHEARLIGEAGA